MVDMRDRVRRARGGAKILTAALWFLAAFVACFWLPDSLAHALAFGPGGSPAFGQELTGNGDVQRSVLSREKLFAKKPPPKPVDDTAGFAIPAGASEPAQIFEGTLTLNDAASSGNFSQIADVFKLIPAIDSPWKHLAPFHFQFVQSGSYLIPAAQGLAIADASPTWNYILGPGRVWNEKGDQGYARAAFPFALIQRNQNCVHNGEMTFLFSNAGFAEYFQRLLSNHAGNLLPDEIQFVGHDFRDLHARSGRGRCVDPSEPQN